jgi:tetratricopeptide (TPR) repeat protein
LNPSKVHLLSAFLSLLLLLNPAAAQSVNARNLLKMSRSSATQADWAKAKEYAELALKEEPGYLDALYMRAFAYREMGNAEKAEADFREVIRQDPRYLPTYGALAEIYVKQKEYDKADKVFLDLGKQPNGEQWANYYRGVIAYLKQDLPGAEGFWKKVLQSDTSFAPAHHNLGALYLAQGNNTKALVNFRAALSQEPEKALYRLHVAWALERTGQVAEAQKILSQILNENSEDRKNTLLATGLDRLTRNNAGTALQILVTAAQENPDNLDVWVLLGRANLALKKPEEARAALEKAKELDPSFQEIDQLMSQLPAPVEEPKVENPGVPENGAKLPADPAGNSKPDLEKEPASEGGVETKKSESS